MKTSNERQAAYRQRIKNSGGIYLGFYLRGEAAELVRRARAGTGASVARIATEAIVQSLKASATPEPKQAAEQIACAAEPVKPEATQASPAEYNWEELS